MVLVPITFAARRLNVPVAWLKSEAEAGRIPALPAGDRLLVHFPTVEKILSERAEKGEIEVARR